MKIAIVGAEESRWSPEEKELVKDFIGRILGDRRGFTFISGGCPKGGVDIWSENQADGLKMEKLIFKPEVEQWEDKFYPEDLNLKAETRKGYKSRNIQIAEACDILYCFSPGIESSLWDSDIGMPISGTGSPKTETCSVWNGGIWTANYAEKLGKKVVRIVVRAK